MKNTSAVGFIESVGLKSRTARCLLPVLAGSILAQVAEGQQFGPQQVITTAVDETNSIFAADLDGDGDQDVLSASWGDDKIAWYENTDGLGAFGPQQVITTAADGAKSVFAADLDGDGDQDVLSASHYEDKIAWYENTNGLGNFGSQQVITTAADGVSSIFAVDLDGDGDQDVLSAEKALAWYENTDGLGTFGAQQIITKGAYAESVFAADMDGDGDHDVLSAFWQSYEISWYENTDGQGSFGPPHVVAWLGDEAGVAYHAGDIRAADLDGDGDQDVLYVGCGHSSSDPPPSSHYWTWISWVENTDGLGTFDPDQGIFIADGEHCIASVFSADLDCDGDQDVLSAEEALSWYENTDGLGTFGPELVITTTGTSSVIAADLDGDGDRDVLAGHYSKIAWYENLQPPLGADVDAISLVSGGAQQFALTAGVDNALRPYLLLGTQSGTSPGIRWDGLVLPLNPDDYFLYSLMNPNSRVLENSLATLASNGTASATFNLPPGLTPTLVGSTLHHAYGVFDLTSTPGSPFMSFVSNAVPLELASFLDCNGNGIADYIDIQSGTSSDCDGNEVPDECQISLDSGLDCDANGKLDSCEIAQDPLLDCDVDGLLDTCDPVIDDCNRNGIPDCLDVQSGTSTDCNSNGIPDECDVASGLLPDCNRNGIADCIDIESGTSTDCNSNGIPDECDVASGVLPDCNGNGIADCIDVESGTSSDCDGNEVPDECQISLDPRLDCDGNGKLDSCEIAQDPFLDCDVDGLLDPCDPVIEDCNGNGVPDCEDVASGTSSDCDGNGKPDECQTDLPDCDGDGVPDVCGPDCNLNGIADPCDILSGFSSDFDSDGVPDECGILFGLMATPGAVSLSEGGNQYFTLLAPGHPSKHYLILGTTAGWFPGLSTPGGQLPLNPSPYFDYSLQNPNQIPLPTSFAVLFPSGGGFSQFVLPPGGPPSLVGKVLHHAFVVFDWTASGSGTGDIVFISNPAGLLVLP